MSKCIDFTMMFVHFCIVNFFFFGEETLFSEINAQVSTEYKFFGSKYSTNDTFMGQSINFVKTLC